MTEEQQKGDAQQGALKDAEPYLVYTGLGIQKEQLYRSFVLEKGNAFNVEPKKKTKKTHTVTFLNRSHLPPKSFYFLNVLFSSNKMAQRNYELLHLISCLLGGNKQKIMG